MGRSELATGTYTIQNKDIANFAYLPNDNERQTVLVDSNDSNSDSFKVGPNLIQK